MRSLTTSKPFKPWFTEKEVKVYNAIREVANNHPLATKITEQIFDPSGNPINLDKLKETALEPIEPNRLVNHTAPLKNSYIELLIENDIISIPKNFND